MWLFVVSCSLDVVYCVSLVIYGLWFCWLLLVGGCWRSAFVRCGLLVLWCALFMVVWLFVDRGRCWLFVVRCLLFVVVCGVWCVVCGVWWFERVVFRACGFLSVLIVFVLFDGVCCLLFALCSGLCVAWGVASCVWSLAVVVCCLSLLVCCSSSVACCLLCVACCSLFVVCCLLCVVVFCVRAYLLMVGMRCALFVDRCLSFC